MNTYEYALEYIKMGFKVIPMHGIKEDGSCTCGKSHKQKNGEIKGRGKHPVTKNGFKDASNDVGQIKKWFNNNNQYNIAVATGRESGVIAIDIDDERGLSVLDEYGIDDTLIQKSGGGGYHVFYKIKDNDLPIKTSPKLLGEGFKVELKGEKACIHLSPSRHEAGNKYEWINGFDLKKIKPIPSWLRKKIENKNEKQINIFDAIKNQKVDFSVDSTSLEDIQEMLTFISSDDYSTWYKVGLALFRHDSLNCFDLFQDWSSKSAKYDSSQTWTKWKSFSNSIDGGITLGTIYHLAQQAGYVDKKTKHGQNLANKFWNALQVRQAKRLAEVKSKKNVKEILKPNFIPKNPNNLIAKITKQIIDTSVYKQPDLAVAAAIGLIGALGGRRYATETDLRTNIYIVGLAESGSGKDWARKIIYKIAYDAGLDRFFGGDKIGSGQGLLASMQEHPMRYYLIDEFGYFMEGISSKNAGSHQKEILNVILQMYSSSNSIFRGTDYADRKTRERKDIIEPTLCIYGTSTHDSFYNSISSSKSIDGTLSRVLFVDAGLDRPKGVRRPHRYTTDDSIIKGLLSIVDSNMFNESGEVGGSKIGSTKIVSMTPDVDDLFYTLSEESYKLSDDSASRSIYSRVAENAIKLSLIYAIADNPENPIIGIDAYEWARDISFYSANLILREIRLRVSDNDQEKNTKKVLSFVKNSKNGITRTELIRKSFFLKRKELDEIIESLKEGGEIEVEIREGKKKPVIYYT